jgi:hypothetical protein
MYGFMYSINAPSTAVAAADTDVDLFEITPADDRIIVIHSIRLFQVTDVGDANEEMLELALTRGHATSGSGGITPDIEALNPNAPANGFTAEAINDTIASAGTPDDLLRDAWNIRAGWLWVPTPEERPIVKQAQTTLVLRQLTTVGSTINIGGTMIVEEI